MPETISCIQYFNYNFSFYIKCFEIFSFFEMYKKFDASFAQKVIVK